MNWPAEWIAEARESPRPAVAAQLPYNLVQRSPVEDEDMIEALGPMSVVASFVLAGGALTGKYPGATGRLSQRARQPALRRGAAGGGAAAAHSGIGTRTAAAIEFAAQAPARGDGPRRRDVARSRSVSFAIHV